jgi:hypothetical protein
VKGNEKKQRVPLFLQFVGRSILEAKHLLDRYSIEALKAELAAKDNIIQVQNKQIEGSKA